MTLEEWKEFACPPGRCSEQEDGTIAVSTDLLDDEAVRALWELDDYRIDTAPIGVLVLRPRPICSCCGQRVGD